VFACDTWLVFDNEKVKRVWAQKILSQEDSHIQLLPQAIVEIIVGRCLQKSGLKQDMEELLFLLMSRGKLDPYQHEICFQQIIGAQAEIWYVMAI
jgi:hypothetical protein